MAAAELCLGSWESVSRRLRREQYMAQRAYKPVRSAHRRRRQLVCP